MAEKSIEQLRERLGFLKAKESFRKEIREKLSEKDRLKMEIYKLEHGGKSPLSFKDFKEGGMALGKSAKQVFSGMGKAIGSQKRVSYRVARRPSRGIHRKSSPRRRQYSGYSPINLNKAIFG